MFGAQMLARMTVARRERLAPALVIHLAGEAAPIDSPLRAPTGLLCGLDDEPSPAGPLLHRCGPVLVDNLIVFSPIGCCNSSPSKVGLDGESEQASKRVSS